MESIRNELHELLTPEKIEAIISDTDQSMKANYEALSQRASGMADVRTYQELLDYCYEQTFAYIDNPDNLMKLLIDSKNIQPVYNSITSTEEFKEICTEEYRGFPRVIAMTILAGSEALAAHAALQNLSEATPELQNYLDTQVDTYQKYLRDALAYGRGDDKRMMMHGEKQ